MRIIKHETRRRVPRSFEDSGYLVIDGVHSVASVEEAVDIAMDCWKEQLATVKTAPTLWETYGDAKCASARR